MRKLICLTLILGLFLSSVQYSNSAGSLNVEKIKMLARAYIYEPQDYQKFEKTYWEYEDFRPFYDNLIEPQIDDYYTEKIREEVLTEFDIIVLTTPTNTLSQYDLEILDKFKKTGGVVIESSTNAYSQLESLKKKFEKGELKSKKETYFYKVKTDDLIIYYPILFKINDIRENANILQEAYKYYYEMIGNEKPFNGESISIAFMKYRWVSMAGQIIRIGGEHAINPSLVNPPGLVYFHELNHDFTSSHRTSTSDFIDLNILFTEAFANLFAHDFTCNQKGYDCHFADLWKNKLEDYEKRRINPYSLDWHGHNEDQQYFEGILFYLSEYYGWDHWFYFFRMAKLSKIPKPHENKIGNMENLRDEDASLAFSRFVYLLSLGVGEDLSPQFEKWRFSINPEVKKEIASIPTKYSSYLLERANSYYNKAIEYYSVKDYKNAENRYEIAKRIFEKIGETEKGKSCAEMVGKLKDSDNDNLPDYDEGKLKTNPNIPDTDNDGIRDGEEVKIGTNPLNPDTDGDGLNDRYELGMIIDGNVEEWEKIQPIVTDSQGDIEGDDKRSADIKMIKLVMDGNNLYLLLEIYGEFCSDCVRNYFIDVSYDREFWDYDFGFRPSGIVWVLVHNRKTNEWTEQSAPSDMMAVGGNNMIEVRIPRREFNIPDNFRFGCRITNNVISLDETSYNSRFFIEKFLALAKTDPLNPDTDGDGLKDGEDPHPLTKEGSIPTTSPPQTSAPTTTPPLTTPTPAKEETGFNILALFLIVLLFFILKRK